MLCRDSFLQSTPIRTTGFWSCSRAEVRMSCAMVWCSENSRVVPVWTVSFILCESHDVTSWGGDLETHRRQTELCLCSETLLLSGLLRWRFQLMASSDSFFFFNLHAQTWRWRCDFCLSSSCDADVIFVSLLTWNIFTLFTLKWKDRIFCTRVQFCYVIITSQSMPFFP